MFRKKRWTALVLTLMFVISSTFPALAAAKNITSVSLRITSDIEAESGSGEVKVTTSNSRYEVEDYYITNEPSSGEWKKGNRPKVRITLRVSDDSYAFKVSKSSVSLSGTEATVSSVTTQDSASKLVINVTLAAIENGSGGYDLDVYDVQWDGDQGYGYWEGGEEAKRFEVKVYRGSSLLNSSTLTTTETSYDFSSYITRSGTYTFRVRGVYNSSYKGSWMESESWYVDSQTARDFRENNESNNTSSTPSGPSNSSNNSSGPGNTGATGAWLQDQVGWWYCNADRSYTVNNWQYIDNKWYFFNERGYMVTGWVLWKNVYYYCGPSGDMLTNTWTPDGYYVDGNGVWVQGMRR